MKKLIFIIFCAIFILVFASCNKMFSYTRQMNKADNLRIFVPNRDSLLYIKNISVINRINYHAPIRKLNKALVDDSTNDFMKIKEGLEALIKENKFLLRFEDSIKLSNDSIYKPLLKNRVFKRGFNYKQLQAIDFKDKEDGLQVVVTVAKEFIIAPGWSGGPTSYFIHIIYDFFDVKGGYINKQTTISTFRGAKAKTWYPLNSDTKKVFEKLYNLKEE